MSLADAKKIVQVYLVDDHSLLRESIANLLRQEPDLSVCGEAKDADRAYREITTLNPDLAIVDISLDNSSGFDLIRNLREEMPELRIAVLSMHDEALYAERCIRAGANGYVMKRETSKRFLTTIREVLAGKTSVSEDITNMFTKKFLNGRRGQDSAPLSELSDRELEVFNMLGQGIPARKIAASLNIHVKTVQAYCHRIKQKLHLSSAMELLREATRWHHDSSNS